MRRTTKMMAMMICIALIFTMVLPAANAQTQSNLRLVNENPPLFHDVCIGESTTLDATAVNDIAGSEITYAWFKEGSDEPIGNDALLEIKPTSLEDGGIYYCLIKDDYGDITYSIEINVYVQTGLTIKNDWEYFENNAAADKGKKIRLSIEATNKDPQNFPITYKWSFLKDKKDRKLRKQMNMLLFRMKHLQRWK